MVPATVRRWPVGRLIVTLWVLAFGGSVLLWAPSSAPGRVPDAAAEADGSWPAPAAVAAGAPAGDDAAPGGAAEDRSAIAAATGGAAEAVEAAPEAVGGESGPVQAAVEGAGARPGGEARRDAVAITSATGYYAVEGGDARALRDSIRQRGPRDAHGAWAASTGWVFRWSFRAVADAGCRIESARVDLDVNYTYPQWIAPPNAAPGLLAAWGTFVARLEVHEEGHAAIAAASARDIVGALEGLGPRASCDDLAGAARSLADGLLARHAEAQVAYDRETGHGVTQGAVLTVDR